MLPLFTTSRIDARAELGENAGVNDNPNWHEETAGAVDNEWLDAIATRWHDLTGKYWEVHDGETRKEGVEANVQALFNHIELLNARAEKAEAQAAAYRKALEDILDAARDPWGNSQHTIAGICNEALGNGKP